MAIPFIMIFAQTGIRLSAIERGIDEDIETTNRVMLMENRLLEQLIIHTEIVIAQLDIRPRIVLAGVADMKPDLMHRRPSMNLIDRVIRVPTATMMTMKI